VIDPGYETTCCLYFAVAPPDHEKAGHLYVYDEIYLHHCDAAKLAREMKLKAAGNWLEAIYMDMQQGRKTESDGLTVAEQIALALADQGVYARDPYFRATLPDIEARIERTRYYMKLKADHDPRLQIFRGKCPWLVWEIPKYRYGRDAHGRNKKLPVSRDNHAMDCLCYGCAADLEWRAPQTYSSHTGISKEDFIKYWQTVVGRSGAASYCFGPSS
jgi:hypothetical protein